jgi:FkbM family methyltransferase
MFAAHYRSGIQQQMKPHHDRIRARLTDTESRAYFDRVTAFYRTLDSRYLAAQPKRIGQYGYDAPGANPADGSAIIDCGAFTGDTFPDFLTATGGKCRIYALEAFPPNFQRLADRIAQDGLQDIAVPMAVAAAREKGTIHMSGDEAIADGCARIGTAGGREYSVPCDTLDSLFFEKGIAIDYLKMDIEGAEMDALAGGRKTLRKNRPVVAVAAYHKPEHLVEIADFLLETLGPCQLYAAHDPSWVFHIHYIAVPDDRAVRGVSLR